MEALYYEFSGARWQAWFHSDGETCRIKKAFPTEASVRNYARQLGMRPINAS